MKFKQHKRKEHPSLWKGILESDSDIKYLKQVAF